MRISVIDATIPPKAAYIIPTSVDILPFLIARRVVLLRSSGEDAECLFAPKSLPLSGLATKGVSSVATSAASGDSIIFKSG